MKYNYIYFNAVSNKRKNNHNEYNYICLKDVEIMDNVNLVSYPLDYANYTIRWLYSIITSDRLKKFFPLLIKKMWYPFYFKDNFSNNNPVAFIVADTYLTNDYLKYLRLRYPGCRLIKVCRDLVKVSERQDEYKLEDMKKNFDLIMSFDRYESEREGLVYFQEIESKIDINPSLDAPKYDIFFAGVAKDRWPRLLKAYKIFTSAGLKCHYYIVNLPKEQQIELEGVEYSNKPLEYTEMLQRSIDSKCLLEINQSGAVGYTSRFLEAVMYNKKLITDNYSIIDDKFYNPKYIQCVKNVDDIDTEFVKSTEEVNYNYKDEFSPIHLIEQIDRELTELDIRETNNV